MKTLALNMIVGPGEIKNLLRCLHAIDAKNFFDEIVLCYTCMDIQEASTNEELLKFNPKIVYHQWVSERYPFGNFAAARNTCIENTSSDFIMWLDCDDILEISEQIYSLKDVVLKSDKDFFFIGYLINKKGDQFTTRFMKERIFRNRSDIRWNGPIHEQLALHNVKSFVTVEGIDIKHYPTREDNLSSIERNLKILLHELNIAPCKHIYLFYALELLTKYRNTKNDNDLKEAIVQIKLCIDHRYGNDDMLAALCFTIAQYYIPMFTTNDNVDLFQAELYANLSLSFSNKYAEPHCILGEISLVNKEDNRAIFHFKEALKKKLDGLSFQTFYFYEEHPAYRLMWLFSKKGEAELALWYSKLVLKHSFDKMHISEMHTFRRNVLEYLLSEEKKWLIM